MRKLRKVRVSRDGQEIGAYETREALSKLSRGELKPTDFYWEEREAKWVSLSKLKLGILDITEYVPPEPPADNRPGSVLGRFLAVVLVLTTLLSVMGFVRVALYDGRDGIYSTSGVAVWLAFITAIWVSGKYEEAVVESQRLLLKVGGPKDGFLFWIFPFFVGVLAGSAVLLGVDILALIKVLLVWVGKL